MKLVKPDATRCAATFGCSVEQAKRLLAKNAVVLGKMANKAARTGKRECGYTEGDLRISAQQYAEASK